MIKAIVFDMGGVLIDLDKQRCIEAFEKLGMTCIREMLDECHQKGLILEMESGQISGDEFFERCMALCKEGTTREDIRQAFLSFCVGIEPYKLQFLHGLEGRYDLYLLSNNNPIVMDEFDRHTAPFGVTLKSTFKKLFFSYQMKVIKPDPEFFRRALEEIGLPPEEVLFIDDNQANCEAAAKFGIVTQHYIVGSDLAAAVNEILDRQ